MRRAWARCTRAKGRSVKGECEREGGGVGEETRGEEGRGERSASTDRAMLAVRPQQAVRCHARRRLREAEVAGV